MQAPDTNLRPVGANWRAMENSSRVVEASDGAHLTSSIALYSRLAGQANPDESQTHSRLSRRAAAAQLMASGHPSKSPKHTWLDLTFADGRSLP